MAYIGRQLARGENKLFDDISSTFNGSNTTFNLTVSSVATATATPYQLFVSLGGVMQKPNTDFTTAGNQITFTTAPAAGLSCWIMMQGDTIDQAAIPDASVTPSKISGSNFAFSGDIRLKDGDGSHYVGFASPTTVAANKVWTLPAADGSASQYLQTNGSGVLTWASVIIGGASGIDFNDNVKTRWGTGNDLEIFHNASNSVINDAGTGDLLLQVGGSTKATVSSTGFDITGALTVSTNAVITGNLTVSGTTTTINTQTLDVEDKNVVIGKVSSPSDTTADGGGWTLKGATDKTLNWINATDAWTSSEHIHLIDNKKLLVGGASGTVDGLEIVHNASDSILNDTGTGTLKLQLGGSTKLEITSGGIDVTGAITVDGAALATGASFTAVANGSIANNKAVKLDTDGKVSQIAEPLGRLAGTGTSANPVNPTPTNNGSVSIDSGFNNWTATAFNTATGKGIAIWNDGGDQKCRGFKVNTSTRAITTSGSVVTLHTGGNDGSHNTVCHITGNKFFVCYRDGGNDVLKARIVTYDSSDGTCTISSETNTSKNGMIWGKSAVYDPDTGLVALAYRDNGDSGHGYVMMATVTGSTPSFHTAVEFHGDPAEFISMCYDTNANRLVITCRGDVNKLPSFVGTVSGTSTSWSSHITIESLDPAWTTICFDSTNNRVFAFWNTGPQKFKVSVGTVATSGNSVSWTTPQQWLTFAGNAAKIECAHDPTLDVVMTCYQDNSDSLKAMARMFWYNSSSNASWGYSRILFGSASAYASCSYMYADSFCCGYNQNNSTYYLNSVRGGGNNPNMPAGDTRLYVGYADQAYTNGQTATIKTYGNTVDTLSGLTTGATYFVQTDGTLATSKDSYFTYDNTPLAGLALSSSKLLIKDPRHSAHP